MPAWDRIGETGDQHAMAIELERAPFPFLRLEYVCT
jgi:hypothetical protein